MRHGRGYVELLENGGGRTPIALPSAYLDNWWNAQQNVTQSGGNVSQWLDVIASMRLSMATVGRQPPIANNVNYNNKPAITFDGVNDTLNGNAGVEVLGVRPWSAFWVGNRVAGAGLYMFGNYMTLGGYQFVRSTNGNVYQLETSPGGIQSSGLLTPLVRHSHVLTYDVGAVNNVKLYVDGVLSWTGSSNGPVAGVVNTEFAIGGIPSGAACCNCLFTDFGVKRNAILNAAAAVALHAWAQAEYGLP